MKKPVVQVRMPPVLNERLKRYAESKNITASDALRRLVERALHDEQGEPRDDRKALMNLSFAFERQSDAITVIGIELHDLKMLVLETCFQVQAVNHIAERAENHGQTAFKVLAELLMAGRFLTAQTGQVSFEKMGEYTHAQLEMMGEEVKQNAALLDIEREQAKAADRRRRPLSARPKPPSYKG